TGHNLKIKLSAGLLACCLTLSAFAQNKTVTSGTETESNQTYADTATDAALLVSGSETQYHGTDINLNATHNASGDPAQSGMGALTKDGASLFLTGGTVNVSGGSGHGVMLYNNGRATLTDVNLNTTNEYSHGLDIRINSTATMTGGAIHTAGRYGIGVSLYDHGAVTLSDVNIMTTGEIGHGIDTYNACTLTLTGGTIATLREMAKGISLDSNSSGQISGVTITTAGEDGHGIIADGESTLLLTDSAIHTAGDNGYGIFLNASTGTLRNVNIRTDGWMTHGINAGASSVLNLAGGTIATTGYASHGAQIQSYGDATISDATISTAGDNSHGVSVRGSSKLALTGGTITTTGNSGQGLYLYDYSTATLTNAIVEATGTDANGIMLAPANGGRADTTLRIDGGTIHSTREAALAINDVNHTLSDANLANMNGNYTITITGGAHLTGATAAINLNTAWNSTTGVVQVPTTAVINIDQASTLTGDVRNTGIGNLTLNLTGASILTGNLIASGSTTTTLNTSQGTTITGDITGNGDATVNLTLTGPGTTFTGNITVSDRSAIALTVSAGALIDGPGTRIESLLTIARDGHLASTITLTNGLTLETGAILDYYTTGALQITGGTLNIADGILVDFANTTLLGDQDYLIMDYTGATGALNAESFTATGLNQDLDGAFHLNNNQLLFHTVIPEPSTWFLLGMGLGTWLLVVCYHQRQAGPTVPRSGNRRRGGSNGIFTR
ncbi:MAG: PEP-CTERM sorting domain-containing protein, partial [Verrucomicrobiales bacterium]|nr:PEP-CTERM sorting domain-containing protein [Verrucomicrobiales bacterium]